MVQQLLAASQIVCQVRALLKKIYGNGLHLIQNEALALIIKTRFDFGSTAAEAAARLVRQSAANAINGSLRVSERLLGRRGSGVSCIPAR